jgi:hypothetical protein
MSPPKAATSTQPAQSDKAARKAARKANRAQKNAELETLQKNGYDPSRNQIDYPNNLQNAQKKASGQ